MTRSTSHLPGAWAEIQNWETGDLLNWMKKVGVSVEMSETSKGWTCLAEIKTYSTYFGPNYQFTAAVTNPDCRTTVVGVAAVVYAAAMSHAHGFSQGNPCKKS